MARDGWSTLKNLLILARVLLGRRSRGVWKAHFTGRDYVDLNPDALHGPYPAILHFLRFGNCEFRNASPRFDTRYYLARYPDVRKSGINALLHFAAFGEPEGRLIPGNFSRRVPALSTANFENLTPPGPRGRGVLLAIPFLTHGGVEMLFRNLADWFANSGWSPIIVTTSTNPAGMPEVPGFFADARCRFFPLERLFISEPERLAFLAFLMKKYKVRLLVLGGSEAMHHWLPAIKHDNPELIVVDHLFNNENYSYNNRYYHDWIDATVVQSACVARQFQKQLGDLAGATHLIPLGVPIPREIASRDSGNPRPLRIGYFGRLAREKGPDVFVEIARRLRKRHGDLRFLIAGDGPERELIRTLVRNAGLQAVVEMPGFVADVQGLMRGTDVVVLPSRADGMPAALLEAQALAIPVVASEVGGIPEIVKDGETGFLCPAEAVGVFCDRLDELIRDPSLRSRLGSAAREFVQSRHSLDQMKTRYLNLFETLVERSPEPRV